VHSAIELPLLPSRQRMIKRAVDVACSAAGLVFLSPLIMYVALRVYLSSEGPVIYSQERVGYLGRIFRIHKFRSMYINAEADGPRLASKSDVRITPWGRIMRRWKLDELPQLWNVLIGDMSMVGPRPEREYYISQLQQKKQPFDQLLQVKPGLTSLGMIRFGYAANVEEMSERLSYDLYYIQKRSLAMDLRIIIDTLRMILADKDK
jgi:lipopolysaccharide/colanic/teichoic acid biosynthesis glycosyltransferase